MYKKRRAINKECTDVSIKSIHNKFEVEVRNVETNDVTKFLAENVVTNSAWVDYIFIRNAEVLRVGESTTEEDPSQTNLISTFVTGKAKTGDPVYAWYGINGNSRSTKYFFGVSENNGKTFAELGLVNGGGSTTVFNRAIMKDINGNPITIAKTDLIEITIYATVYVTIDLQPWQSLQSESALFSLINGGNQDFYVWSLTNNNGSVGGNYTKTPGKLEKVTGRIQPGSVNKGISYIRSWCINHDLLRGPTLYTLTQQTLATGNGVKTDFYCGYLMETLSLYRNGILIPTTEYTFNKYATDQITTFEGKEYYNSSFYAYDEYNRRCITSNGAYKFSKLDTQISGPIDYLYCTCTWSQSVHKASIKGSNDGVTWTLIREFNNGGSQWFPMDGTYRYYSYSAWSTGANANTESQCKAFTLGGPQIRFKTPPAEGDIITFSGQTKCIPKDENHVMEMSTTLTYVDPTATV